MSKFSQATYFYKRPSYSNGYLCSQTDQKFFGTENVFYTLNNDNAEITSKKITITLQNNIFSPEIPYLLHYRIRNNLKSKIDIYLTGQRNGLEPQPIYSFNRRKESREKTQVDVVFTPHIDCNQIQWQFSTKITDPSSAIDDIHICPLNELNITQNNKIIKKIGIQGYSFMYIVINGEPIRVGRNGVYELEGINITDVRAAPIADGTFIIDYTYDD